MKRLLKVLGIVIILIVIIWCIGRYGWKIAGFRCCTSTGIEYISVSNDQVEVKGFYAGSFPTGYVGAITKVEEGKLYLGVRYDAIFGCFEEGTFQITIPVKDEINQIYVKNNTEETLIWDRESDPAVKESGFFRDRTN